MYYKTFVILKCLWRICCNRINSFLAIIVCNNWLHNRQKGTSFISKLPRCTYLYRQQQTFPSELCLVLQLMIYFRLEDCQSYRLGSFHYHFVDYEGTKRERQLILYSAITGHFIQQNRCQFANMETEVYLHRWSTDENIDICSIICNSF